MKETIQKHSTNNTKHSKYKFWRFADRASQYIYLSI